MLLQAVEGLVAFLGLQSVAGEVALAQALVGPNLDAFLQAVGGHHSDGVLIDAVAVLVNAVHTLKVADVKQVAGDGVVGLLLHHDGFNLAVAVQAGLGRVGIGGAGLEVQSGLLHGLQAVADLDALHIAVLVEGDVDELDALGDILPVGDAAELDADVAGLQAVGMAGARGIDVIDVGGRAVHQDPVGGADGAFVGVLHQVAGLHVAEVAVIDILVGADVQGDLVALDIPAVDIMGDLIVDDAVIVALDNHEVGGVAHALGAQSVAILVQIELDILAGNLDVIGLDAGQVLVPQGHLVSGAAHGNINRLALSLRVAIGGNAGQLAGNFLGDIGLAHLEVAAVVVSVHGHHGHKGAGLQTGEQGVISVLLLHVLNLHVDGSLVIAGIGNGAAVGGADAVQSDIVAGHALDRHHLGLDHHDMGDQVGVLVVHIELHQGAVVGVIRDGGNLLLIAVKGVFNQLAVDIQRSVLVVNLIAAQAQSANLAAVGNCLHIVGRLGGVGEVGRNGEGADGDQLVAPHVGGPAKVVDIGALFIHAQVFEVLLTELDGPVVVSGVAAVAALLVADVLGVLLVAGDIGTGLGAGNGSVAGGDVEAAGVLHQSGLQGVQSQLAGLLAGDGVSTLEAQAVEQAGSVADPGHVHGPAGAGEALKLALIAQRAQQHLGEGEAGQGVGGLKGAVAIAADIAGGLAVADDARKGVAGGNVGIGAGAVGEIGGRLRPDHQGNDDLRRGAAGQLGFGTERAVLIAGDNADPVQNGNGFLVLDLVLVGKVLVLGGPGADGGQRHSHDQREDQG